MNTAKRNGNELGDSQQTLGEPALRTRRYYCIHRRRLGQILPIVAVFLVALVACLGMVLDTGLLNMSRRSAQRAADAAAQAGAVELLSGSGSTNAATTMAMAYAVANKMSSNLVFVEIPPATSVSYNGSNGFIRVRTATRVNVMFASLLSTVAGTNLPQSIDVYATATAGVHPVSIPITVMALNPTVSGALTISGGGALNVGSGTVYVNSSNKPKALSLSGGSTITTSAEVDVVGAVDYPSNVHGTLKTGVAPAPDPLAGVPEPVLGNYTQSPNSGGSQASPAVRQVSGTITLRPGIYYGGLKIMGGSIATMLPGTYVMAGGGFTVSASTARGTNIFIYNTQDPPPHNSGAGAFKDITISGTSQLSAPSVNDDPVYNGILFFQDRNLANTSKVVLSGGSTIPGVNDPLKGYIYNANGQVNISGGSSAGLGVIADTIIISGASTLGAESLYTPSKLFVRLVE